MLKDIFVPTDFSECADYAVDAGLKFARRFNATLHLYHWLEMPVKWTAMTTAERDEFPGIQNYLTVTVAQFEQIVAANRDVKIVHSISGGNFQQVMRDYQAHSNIDLMIMGSHGATGANAFFLGSVTQRAVRMVHCPVLIIKAPLLNINFDKVIYASNFAERDRASFKYFKSLIKNFVPEVHLLPLQPIALFSTPLVVYREAMKDFAQLAKPLSCVIHDQQRFTDEGDVREFAQQIGADLMVISNHERHPVQRLIVGSMVEYLVNRAQLPVLSIDYLEK